MTYQKQNNYIRITILFHVKTYILYIHKKRNIKEGRKVIMEISQRINREWQFKSILVVHFPSKWKNKSPCYKNSWWHIKPWSNGALKVTFSREKNDYFRLIWNIDSKIAAHQNILQTKNCHWFEKGIIL